MYGHLSENQQKVLNFADGAVVVKACPGSGKTYSIAARISKLLRDSQGKDIRLGITSFTNTAIFEIEDKLASEFNTHIPLMHPHFLGTIDSFLNTFVFLPFGHLVMGCPSRPELIGEPHGHWNMKRYALDYDQYFDKTSFNLVGELIPLAPYQAFHFTWNYHNKNGSVNGNIANIIKSKQALFKRGYANQADANYISLRILQKYPLIRRNLADKFTHLLIDECQDTTEVQMAIIDLLYEAGCHNIMLVGDRDQSIFEWNDAKPELFDAKFNAWEKIVLDQNRRSSQLICNFFKNLSSFDHITAVAEGIHDYPAVPEILSYRIIKKATKKDPKVVTEEESIQSFTLTLSAFLDQCREANITIDKESVAVLYRGSSNGKYLGLGKKEPVFGESPWIANNYHVRSAIKGKHLYEHGNFAEGYKFMEKSLLEALNSGGNRPFHCTQIFVSDLVDRVGLRAHREKVFKFISCLPSTQGVTIAAWTNQANQSLLAMGYTFTLAIADQFGHVLIDHYFAEDSNSDRLHPFYFGTVHSVKGKTFEAVLMLLGRKASQKNYQTILETPDEGLTAKDREEKRILYVGLSRPKKIVKMVVPESDKAIWAALLQK
ncbi:UvrD-helicase domain-containing protein [Flavobacterium sp. MFBS3-15]|uniref:UvrD-helicase domain-containing protein n=1 Tax=Flavobacterium sp. MFBS3-15 TaxID=2989816 RepID=UPI002235CAEC|nr:ATP-dependent helicase [Flavobacterium sp. MFBS3-15]MCW4470236.1 UvrD-helicase domain-containing protein [Flavobacterium sp. MFBS3-15]